MPKNTPEYVSAQALLAITSKPCTEDYTLDVRGNSLTFRVEGIQTYMERTKLFAAIAAMKAKKPAVQHQGETFEPEDLDISAAHWCAACVKQPAMDAYAWLRFAKVDSSALRLLMIRSMVCAREIADPELGKEAPGPIDEAKEALANDPLAEPSSASA